MFPVVVPYQLPLPNTWEGIEAAPEWIGPKGCDNNTNAAQSYIRLYDIQKYGGLDNAVLYANIDPSPVPIEDIT